MVGTLSGLLLAMAFGARADIYVSEGADGSLEFSNLQQPGRRYTQVYPEPMPGPAPGKLVLGGWSENLEQRPYAELIASEAAANDVPEALLHAVIQVESGYDPKARSEKGAAGLMQLMPGTAKQLGVGDVWDPAANIRGGARYLKQLLQRFDNDLALAVAAYNAGPEAVSKAGRVPPYAETQRYVPSVLESYKRLAKGKHAAPM
ncbi:lytic transglycosylase domain-containing protein [Pseudomonas citronellolis]|uniref:lytic transglycosylase domain-containing protein n=1 Tax=Pseudomonas citronellolis TaxID=53408 RepID=UPI003D346791